MPDEPRESAEQQSIEHFAHRVQADLGARLDAPRKPLQQFMVVQGIYSTEHTMRQKQGNQNIFHWRVLNYPAPAENKSAAKQTATALFTSSTRFSFHPCTPCGN